MWPKIITLRFKRSWSPLSTTWTGFRTIGLPICAYSHVETVLAQWGSQHCSVNEQAEEVLRKAEDNYDNLSLPVMVLVSEALKHENHVVRLKAIFEPLETVELTDDVDDDAGDGNAE
ncbi:hypothetical protein Hanom_Chr01g00018491 [Helianthus anomalus]